MLILERTFMILGTVKLTILLTFVCVWSTLAYVRTNSMTEDDLACCASWQAKVDPNVKPLKECSADETSDKDVMKGIECLMRLEGRKGKSKHQGATRLYVSQGFGPASVEVAALYYVSYLYCQKWDHASAIALRDEKGGVDKPEAVRQAFESYKKWFKEVEKVGLAKAREMKLEPLKDTRVHWY
jgi:hypothetical protein